MTRLRVVALCAAAASCAHVPSALPARDQISALVTFDSAWSLVNATYFDSTFGGLDWRAVRTALRPQAASATTPDALRRVMQRMLDTLGESHARVLAREDVLPSSSEVSLAEPGFDTRPISGGALVVRVDSGTPAAHAGVRPGWVMTAIGGQPASTLSRRDLSARLRGESGSEVSVVLEDLRGVALEMTLARSTPAGILAIVPNLPPRVVRFRAVLLVTPGDPSIGLIQFGQWLLPVAAALDSAMHELCDAHGMIIDLRGNSGGLGAMVAGFAGYFVDTATVVGVVRTRQSVLRLVAQPRVPEKSAAGAVPFDGPVAILVDRFTGSASEVFASGMQGAGRARVFGDTTAGAVLPSALDRLPNGDVLQHPISDFVTPAGVRLEGRGVWPDEPVVPGPKDYTNDEDPVLSAATRWMRAFLTTRPRVRTP